MLNRKIGYKVDDRHRSAFVFGAAFFSDSSCKGRYTLPTATVLRASAAHVFVGAAPVAFYCVGRAFVASAAEDYVLIVAASLARDLVASVSVGHAPASLRAVGRVAARGIGRFTARDFCNGRYKGDTGSVSC